MTNKRFDSLNSNLMFGLLVKGLVLSLVFFGSGVLSSNQSSSFFINEASAQDLLPEDNGVHFYHGSPRYRESEGHPLRLLAYALHPFGWGVRELAIRPISAFVSSNPFNRSLFGFREPYDYREAVCFDTVGAIPDCKTIPPWNSLSAGPGSLVSGANGSGSGSGRGKGGMYGGSLVGDGLSERQVYIPDIAFDYNKSSLNALGLGRVRQVSQLLKSVPGLSIVVEGHADVRGGDKYNENLGMKRAQRVIGELVKLGISADRLSPATYGEKSPIFAEGAEWAYAVNRRVQFSAGGGGQES